MILSFLNRGSNCGDKKKTNQPDAMTKVKMKQVKRFKKGERFSERWDREWSGVWGVCQFHSLQHATLNPMSTVYSCRTGTTSLENKRGRAIRKEWGRDGWNEGRE